MSEQVFHVKHWGALVFRGHFCLQVVNLQCFVAGAHGRIANRISSSAKPNITAWLFAAQAGDAESSVI